MTSIPYSFWFNHLTEIDGVQWRPIDWDAAKIVRGLKQEPFKGYVRWKVGGAWRDFTTANVEHFVDVILPSLGGKIGELIDGDISIVPIPNSGMAIGAKGDFRVVDLATKLVAGIGARAKMIPAIRWDKPREKSHKTRGMRSPEMYQPFMRLADRPTGKVVLFDDVLTSGSQSVAAARFLKENGYNVVHAVTVAKAGKTQVDKPFEFRTEELLIDQPGWDFGDF